MTANHSIEPAIENIILDGNSIVSLDHNKEEEILFSALRADAQPLIPYKLNVSGLDYPQYFSAKCAICNSPHRTLLEHVYIDSNKKVNTVLKFFERHFNARLNWAQVKQHIKYHCDFDKIETPGLLDYENQEDMVGRWKFREFELAEIAILMEMNDVRGMQCKNNEEVMKRASIMDKLAGKLLAIKEKRDDSSLGLPNVFEVLHDIHNMMRDEEDKRIIREKVRELRQAIV